MKLTIAIPTYNRNEILKRHIRFLLPQLNEDCFLLIIDNCSLVPVEDTLTEIISKYPLINYRIIRNKVNIGGNANIIRCFEFCETEWLWLLGDDDVPLPNAIETIFYDIFINKELTHINYYAEAPIHPVRSVSTTSKGMDEYLIDMDSFAASIFISCNVYHVPDVVEAIGYAMFLQNSCAPQFVILALSLGKDRQSMFSHKVIVKDASNDTPKADVGSPLPIANGLISLLNLPLPYETKLLIKKKIIDGSLRNWVRPESIFAALLMEWNKSKDTRHIRFKYQQVKKNYLTRTSSTYIKIKVFFYSFLIIFPSIGYKIMLYILKRKDQKYETDVVRREL